MANAKTANSLGTRTGRIGLHCVYGSVRFSSVRFRVRFEYEYEYRFTEYEYDGIHHAIQRTHERVPVTFDGASDRGIRKLVEFHLRVLRVFVVIFVGPKWMSSCQLLPAYNDLRHPLRRV